MTTRIQQEMRQALQSEFPLPGQSERPAYERLADAAYAAVEPLLQELLRASKKHPFLPDMGRALRQLEDALEVQHDTRIARDGAGYRAVCSCGWCSRAYLEIGDARAAEQRHLEKLPCALCGGTRRVLRPTSTGEVSGFRHSCPACGGSGANPGEPQNDIPPHVCQTCGGGRMVQTGSADNRMAEPCPDCT